MKEFLLAMYLIGVAALFIYLGYLLKNKKLDTTDEWGNEMGSGTRGAMHVTLTLLWPLLVLGFLVWLLFSSIGNLTLNER